MEVIELTKALISCQSVTPKNDGVLDLLEKELSSIGFDCRRYLFSDSNTPDVDNLYAKIGNGAPHICFGGHTDVVPVGDISAWSCDPFNATEKDGKVYISMDAKLLFASGSTKVDSEGIKALKELAKVLEDQKDLEILVEGHTDTDKMRSNSHPVDNWELSVLRATSVVKIMLENSKMDPTTVSASGRSQFIPIDAENKAKNRRIEVVLIPELDELFEIINN